MVGTRAVVHDTPSLGWRRPFVLRLSMVDFERRGFRTDPAETRAALEAAAGAFLTGFNAELATPPDRAPDLSPLPPGRRGFAAEGAGMAAALLDTLALTGGRRLATLRSTHDDRYEYLIHVGVGWAMAKLRRTRLGRLGADAPLLRWLAYDGMGFCQAFFAGHRRLRRWTEHAGHPDRCPLTCHIRYQGLGRSLWFRACGDAAELAAHVAALPPRHRGDAWSGIALAASYAGGVEPEAYARIPDLTGEHRAAAAQGAAFAAEAWERSGYVPAHAHACVEALAGVPVARAAGWTWDARRGLDRPGAGAADYQRWRERVRERASTPKG
jgi:hypothetical protein